MKRRVNREEEEQQTITSEEQNVQKTEDLREEGYRNHKDTDEG